VKTAGYERVLYRAYSSLLIKDLVFKPYMVYREVTVAGSGSVSGACVEYLAGNIPGKK
jgi:hypothetical protein